VIGLGVTPPFVREQDQIARSVDVLAAIPWKAETDGGGIALGTDFLGVEETLPGLGNAPEVIEWVISRFSKDMARRLLFDNARSLVASLSGETIGS
jgi:membrane dipeptidase